MLLLQLRHALRKDELMILRPLQLTFVLPALLLLVGIGAAQAASPAPPVPLLFSEMLVPSPTALQPSPKLLALSGKRVRLSGYMVKTAEALPGAFYLTEHPTFCDEEGAGTADLPPACVRVVVRGAKNRPLSFVGRPLIVTGILQVGPKTESDGQVSHLRLILDGPEPAPAYSAVKKIKQTTKIKETNQ